MKSVIQYLKENGLVGNHRGRGRNFKPVTKWQKRKARLAKEYRSSRKGCTFDE